MKSVWERWHERVTPLGMVIGSVTATLADPNDRLQFNEHNHFMGEREGAD